MSIYDKIRLVTSGRMPSWLKLAGLAGMLAMRRRVIGVFLDPVNGCNLRCRMCYFSDEVKRRQMVGRMTEGELDDVERILFPYALKLQIGCGAEPTLDNRLVTIVERGRKAGVPFISLTTNGQLIADGRVDILALCRAGLDEITLSMHGTRRETYEYLMPGASYDKFGRLVAMLEDARRQFPSFKIRINFTVNSMNVDDLCDSSFWDLWTTSGPDILQLRPVQKIGESQWNDFDLSRLLSTYDTAIGRIMEEARRRGITVIGPTREQIEQVAGAQDAASAIIEDISYCYVAHDSFYKPDFDPSTNTFPGYHRRHRTIQHLLRSIFTDRSRRAHTSKKLNYTVSK